MVSLLWGPVKQERQLRQGILLLPGLCVHWELDSWTAIVYSEGTPSVICPVAGGTPEGGTRGCISSAP